MDGLNIPLNHILLVSSLLFAIGMLGLMIRRNIIFILMSLEVMLNAAALAFVAAGAHWGQPDGQVVFMLILTVAAADAPRSWLDRNSSVVATAVKCYYCKVSRDHGSAATSPNHGPSWLHPDGAP